MFNQIDHCHITIEMRDFRPNPEVCQKMNTKSPLTPEERLLLTRQTGQLLVALGGLLASPSIGNEHISGRTSQSLMGIGRKLLSAGKCTC
jgi:hypothetical protein